MSFPYVPYVNETFVLVAAEFKNIEKTTLPIEGRRAYMTELLFRFDGKEAIVNLHDGVWLRFVGFVPSRNHGGYVTGIKEDELTCECSGPPAPIVIRRGRNLGIGRIVRPYEAVGVSVPAFPLSFGANQNQGRFAARCQPRRP